MHFIARNYNQGINNCAQMLMGPRTCAGHVEGGGNKRNIKSGAAGATACELWGKQTPSRGPPVSLETTDGRLWDFFPPHKPLSCTSQGLLKHCVKKEFFHVCIIISTANIMLYNQH